MLITPCGSCKKGLICLQQDCYILYLQGLVLPVSCLHCLGCLHPKAFRSKASRSLIVEACKDPSTNADAWGAWRSKVPCKLPDEMNDKDFL